MSNAVAPSIAMVDASPSSSSTNEPPSKLNKLGAGPAGSSGLKAPDLPPPRSASPNPIINQQSGPIIIGGAGRGGKKFGPAAGDDFGGPGGGRGGRGAVAAKHKKVVCVLVVGPRGAGKTTLIKQARICCGYRFSPDELLIARSLMRLSVFESVKLLWREIHRTNFRIQNIEMMELLQRALATCSLLNGTILPNDELIGAIGNFVYDYEVQNFIETNNLQKRVYSSTFDYAISHIKRILADDYVPSMADLMHIDYMGRTDSKNSLGSVAQKQLLAMANSGQGHEKALQAVEINLPSKHSLLMMEIAGDLTGKRYLLNQPEAFDCLLYVYDVSQHGAMSTRDGVTKSVLMRNIDNMQNSLGRLRQFAIKPLLIVVNKFDVLLKKLIGIPLERSFPDHEGGLDPSAIKDTIVRHIRATFEGRQGVVHIFFANSLDSLDILQPVIDLMLIGRWISLIDRVRRTAQSSQKTQNSKLALKTGPGGQANAIKLDEHVYTEIAAQDMDDYT